MTNSTRSQALSGVSRPFPLREKGASLHRGSAYAASPSPVAAAFFGGAFFGAERAGLRPSSPWHRYDERVPAAARTRSQVAEDARFELARGCPQHAFQACALGQLGESSAGQSNEPARPVDDVASRRTTRIQWVRPLVWRYPAQPPQGRKAARVSGLWRVREGGRFLAACGAARR